MIANETFAAYLNPDKALADRKLFVHNLGVLLAQTREQVISAELNDDEEVVVTYKGGRTKAINVNMNSYMAIVRDVSKYI